MRLLKNFLYGILFLGFVAVIFLGWQQYFPYPNQLDTDIQIGSDGRALQLGHTIALGKVTSGRTEWRIPLAQQSSDPIGTSFSIVFPKPFSPQDVTGYFISIQGTAGMHVQPNSDKTVLVSAETILPESHTFVVISVPTSVVKPDAALVGIDWIENRDLTWWELVSASLVALTALITWLITRSRALRTTEEESTPPEKLSLLEIAIIDHGRFFGSDLAAVLYDLAERGYVQIFEDSEVFITRTSQDSTVLRPSELRFLELVAPHPSIPNNLENVLTTLQATVFSKEVSIIYHETYASLHLRGLFREDLRQLHLRYKTLGIIIQFASLLLAIASYFLLQNRIPGLVLAGIAGFCSGYLIYECGYRMKPFTMKGWETRAKIHSFINYLNNPTPIGVEGSQGYLFYKYLPYAVVLRQEQAWFDRFERQNNVVPEWFETEYTNLGDPGRFFNILELTILTFTHQLTKLKDPNAD